MSHLQVALPHSLCVLRGEMKSYLVKVPLTCWHQEEAHQTKLHRVQECRSERIQGSRGHLVSPQKEAGLGWLWLNLSPGPRSLRDLA
jgi:hypothetical protein